MKGSKRTNMNRYIYMIYRNVRRYNQTCHGIHVQTWKDAHIAYGVLCTRPCRYLLLEKNHEAWWPFSSHVMNILKFGDSGTGIKIGCKSKILLWILDAGTWGSCVGHASMLAGSNRPGQIGKFPFQLLIFKDSWDRSAKEYQHEQRNAMGCFSSGCFKEELLDILRCRGCQAHDFNKSSLPMASIYSDVKQLAGSSCQMIWTFMNFARVTLRRASLRGASWAAWIMWASWPTQMTQFLEYKLIVLSALAQRLWWHVSGNSLVKGNVSSGSQQQYLARNSQAVEMF